MLDVSIIIVSYNTCTLTLQCIQSIYEKTEDVSFEIIVVDNASVDDTVQKIEKKYPEVIVVKNMENVGFGRANNIGYTLSSGRFVFFLNSDTILLNNALKCFLQFSSNRDYENEIYGSVLLSKGLLPIHSFAKFPTICSELKFILSLILGLKKQKDEKIPNPFPNEGLSVDYITGADLFIHRNVLEKVGVFDPYFFLYYEETDLQKRMQLMNIERIVIDTPQIIHYHGMSQKKKRNERTHFYSFESQIKYIKKYNLPLKYYLFRIAYFFLLFPLVFYWKKKKSKLSFFKILMSSY